MVAGRGARLGAIALVAVLGGLIAGITTRHGVGGRPDTTAYVAAADNLVHQGSLTVPFDNDLYSYPPAVAARFHGKVPLTNWPPGYPVALAAGGAVGLGFYQTARIIDVAALAATGALVVLIVLWATGSLLVAALAGMAVVAAPLTIDIYALALSESLYIVLLLLAGFLTLLYVERRHRLVFAALTLVVLAATTVRYAGIALAPALALALLWAGWRGFRELWWRRAATLVVAGAAPAVLWSLFTRSQGGSSARTLGLYPVQYRVQFESALQTIGGWFMPFGHSTLLSGVVVVIVGVAIVVALWRPEPADSTVVAGAPARAPVAIVVFLSMAIGQFVVVVATMMFLDRNQGLQDARDLLPMLAPLVIVVMVVVWRLSTSIPVATTAVGVTAVAVLALLIAWPPDADHAVRSAVLPARAGIDRGWPELIKRLPRGTVILTNGPDQVWGYTRYRAVLMPERVSLETGRRNPHFDRDVAQAARLMRGGHGLILQFPPGFQANRLATVDDLRSRYRLVEQASAPGWSIWSLAS